MKKTTYKSGTSRDSNIIPSDNKGTLSPSQQLELLLTKSSIIGGAFGSTLNYPPEFFRQPYDPLMRDTPRFPPENDHQT